jgi:hypothetical protein
VTSVKIAGVTVYIAWVCREALLKNLEGFGMEEAESVSEHPWKLAAI